VQEQTNYSSIKVSNWGRALDNTRFRNKLIAGVLVFACILAILPNFFAMIENRNGLIINDWLLNVIGPRDFSIPIFIIIWSTTLLFFFRSAYQPTIFLQAIYAVIFLTLLRMLTIYLVALDPPATIIAIKDPLTSLTYGGKDIFITKDLFFSGHTSNMLILALCFEKKTDKMLGYFAAVSVGILVLFQHAHYSIDVIAAFIITFIVVRFAKRMAIH
jgi:membrane-associated phospholipid phosphatase